ncbi:MAG: class I SAM-dependent methyltransferase [Candidatus Aenigmatarchaeota archaeon]
MFYAANRTSDKGVINGVDQSVAADFAYDINNGSRIWRSNLTFSDRYTEFLAPVASYLETKRGNPQNAGALTILDIGCSTGEAMKNMQNYLANLGYKTRSIGVDVSEDAAKIAKSNDLDEIIVTDAQHLPFDASSMDIVCAMNFMHFIGQEDQAKCLREIKRVLKNDGILSCTVKANYRYNDIQRANNPILENKPYTINAALMMTGKDLEDLKKQSNGFNNILYEHVQHNTPEEFSNSMQKEVYEK